MPETPTPSVNGQSLSGPALQASMSMLSFAPAATTFVATGLTATAGSFCLFCENGVVGLPTVTSASCAGAGAANAAPRTAAPNTAIAERSDKRLPTEDPLLMWTRRLPAGRGARPDPTTPALAES